MSLLALDAAAFFLKAPMHAEKPKLGGMLVMPVATTRMVISCL